MIVFDASAVVGAALRANGVPERALMRAAGFDQIALSAEVDDEIAGVLSRPKFMSTLPQARGAMVLDLLRTGAVWFAPVIRVMDCRDAKDNKYLELALAAGADAIVSSDNDLLVLDPWRGVRILTPRAYLDLAAAGVTQAPEGS